MEAKSSQKCKGSTWPVQLNQVSHVSDDWFRSSHPEVFLRKEVLKICIKFTGEHPCQSAVSINLQSNFIEIALWHGCSPVNLLHIFRTLFHWNRNSAWVFSCKFAAYFQNTAFSEEQLWTAASGLVFLSAILSDYIVLGLQKLHF